MTTTDDSRASGRKRRTSPSSGPRTTRRAPSTSSTDTETPASAPGRTASHADSGRKTSKRRAKRSAPIQQQSSGELPALVQRAMSKWDPAGWAPATATVVGRAATNPLALGAAAIRAASSAAQIPLATAARVIGETGPEPGGADRRFSGDAWQQNPLYFGVAQTYGVTARLVEDILAAGARGDLADLKAKTAVSLVLDALAPTNSPLTNPDVAVRAFQTGGKSLVNGARQAFADIRHRGGAPLKVDREAFTLGENMACTPGRVVFRNDLIELIQYAPQTERVHRNPLLCSPPWINKYYVMDLAPNRSFVEMAVREGHTVFMISYRNPDESMRDVTMDDYFAQGIGSALDVVEDITGADTIDVAGLCLGGAMAAICAAQLAAIEDVRLGSLTLFNTMLDYTQPGELRGFVDPPTLERIGVRMRDTGFLAAQDMALTFDLLRARDLIFRYIPSRWLMGEAPTAFDILAWNDDATRMPAAMHGDYLDRLYGQNLLATGDFVIDGVRLDLGAITNDTYVVGAINDHIVPWTSSYAATGLIGGEVRYVLSSGGHIAGIVNPPSPKAWYEVGEMTAYPEDPLRWREVAEHQKGSWWSDWARWSAERAGEMVAAPPMGSDDFPAIEDAPGTYVRQTS